MRIPNAKLCRGEAVRLSASLERSGAANDEGRKDRTLGTPAVFQPLDRITVLELFTVEQRTRLPWVVEKPAPAGGAARKEPAPRERTLNQKPPPPLMLSRAMPPESRQYARPNHNQISALMLELRGAPLLAHPSRMQY